MFGHTIFSQINFDSMCVAVNFQSYILVKKNFPEQKQTKF